VVYPLFKEKGLLGTAYILSGDFGLQNYMSQDELKQMHNDGFELGSHTVSHPHLPFISASASFNELRKSKNDIASYIGHVPNNFASPYGEYNDMIKLQASNFYRSHRSTESGYNTKDSFDIYNIKTQNATNSTTPEMVMSWVDTAIQDNAWLVLVYHDISNGDDRFTNTPEHLEAVLDGLLARGVVVATVDAALDEIVPQLQE
jgi:peptidoglycan/xylan/chitin deacetylase (PgdA/CDA1 family)